MNGPIKLATPILLTLIRRYGGEPHPTLSGMATWYDDSVQRTIDQEVNALLARHGLMGPRGVDRDLRGLVESIARPQLEYYGWFEGQFPDAPAKFSVLAGSGSGGAFVLVCTLTEGSVILAPERPQELLAGFLAQIPAGRAAGGQPLIAPKAEYLNGRRAVAEGEFSVMRPANATAVPDPAKQMKQIMESERTGAGSVYVAARTRAGTRRRNERPVNFIDATGGRWLMEERPGRGDPLMVFTPGTPQAIAERLRNAQSALG